MKKTEFFDQLKSKLAIIEEQELNDILNEYEQHIALKTENGNISEEEAIKDFGNIDELAAEILEAYHVRANYEQNIKMEKQQKRKENAKEFTKDTQNYISNKWKLFQNNCKQFIKHIKTKYKISKEKFCNLFVSKQKNLEHTNFSEHVENKTFFQKIKSFFIHLFLGCLHLFLWCMKLIWNFLLFVLISCLLIMTVVIIFIFGTSLVLSFQGYPLWFFTLGAFGIIFFNSSLITMISLFFKKKKIELEDTQKPKRKIIEISSIGCAILGILLIGISTGMGVIEFSEFSYGGEVVFPNKKETENIITSKIPDDFSGEIILSNIYNNHGERLISSIEEDQELKENEIKYVITTNADSTDLTSHTYTIDNDENNNKNTEYYVGIYSQSDGIKTFMLLKDQILNDIKNKKIYSYHPYDSLSAKVYVHPNTLKRCNLQ